MIFVLFLKKNQHYYKDGKIFGWNAFLQFYDISIDEQIKTLKLGDGEYGGDIKLANKKTLLLSRKNSNY